MFIACRTLIILPNIIDVDVSFITVVL